MRDQPRRDRRVVPGLHRLRRSVRLPGFDYAQPGGYYVTICTKARACVLGTIENGSVALSSTGDIVHEAICAIPFHVPGISVDAYVIMPDHVHVVLLLSEGCSTVLGDVVRAFKARVSRKVGSPIWQRSYYEHVIRSDDDLARIRQYIQDNPARWAR